MTCEQLVRPAGGSVEASGAVNRDTAEAGDAASRDTAERLPARGDGGAP